MNAGDLSVSDIAAQLAGNAEELCRELLPGGHRDGNEWRCGDVGGAKGKSLGVHLRGEKVGVWSDFASGEAGDLIDLIQAVKRIDKGCAVSWAKNYLGIKNGDAATNSTTATSRAGGATASGDDDAHRRIEYARELWQRAVPAEGTPVAHYLRSRGITIPVPTTIRYIPDLKHGPSGLILPAMVAAVQGLDRRVYGIHRTFLTADGTRKAPLTQAKMMIGKCAGGAVRLGPAAPKIAVAEGVETALSIAQACPDLPVWAALSTSGIRALILPPEVVEVTLCGDGDAAGDSAVTDAAKRFIAEGRQVRIARAPPGQDFNDVLVGKRVENAE